MLARVIDALTVADRVSLPAPATQLKVPPAVGSASETTFKLSWSGARTGYHGEVLQRGLSGKGIHRESIGSAGNFVRRKIDRHRRNGREGKRTWLNPSLVPEEAAKPRRPIGQSVRLRSDRPEQFQTRYASETVQAARGAGIVQHIRTRR